MQTLIDDPASWERCRTEAKQIILGILTCEKPIIAKINGAAAGLGATLALFCDIIFAADSATISDPHVSVGLVAGDGGAVIWPQLVGFAKAKELLLTGDRLTARDAQSVGLINYAVPDDELEDRVNELAARLAAGARYAIRYTKAAVNIPLLQIANAVLETSLAYETVSNFSADHCEALKALRERRAPSFLWVETRQGGTRDSLREPADKMRKRSCAVERGGMHVQKSDAGLGKKAGSVTGAIGEKTAVLRRHSRWPRLPSRLFGSSLNVIPMRSLRRGHRVSLCLPGLGRERSRTRRSKNRSASAPNAGGSRGEKWQIVMGRAGCEELMVGRMNGTATELGGGIAFPCNIAPIGRGGDFLDPPIAAGFGAGTGNIVNAKCTRRSGEDAAGKDERRER